MNTQKSKAPKNLGLYIHVPFCRTKCLYCGFCSFPAQREEKIEQYVKALCGELTELSAECKGYTLDTVYFGGGTPTTLSTEQFSRIFSAIRQGFSVADDAEITVECNPSGRAEDKEYLSSLRALSVNRLSMGVQSAVDAELKLLGRAHTFDKARATYLSAREAGFENISLDLMFGIPSQSMESLGASLDALIDLSPEHISIYSLQLEEGTPLFRRRDKYDIPSDELVADMYEVIVERMRDAGYSHYEISNFAKEGYESRHNTRYWRLSEYIGAGPSAHSDFAGKRYENTSLLDEYLSGVRKVSEREIGEKERQEEYIMLGLRTSKGISASEFFARFGKDIFDIYGEGFEKMRRLGYLEVENGEIRLNEQGFEVSNAILSEILELEY